jgi:primary-amine oxidase
MLVDLRSRGLAAAAIAVVTAAGLLAAPASATGPASGRGPDGGARAAGDPETGRAPAGRAHAAAAKKPAPAPHPLDPLDRAEIVAAFGIIEADDRFAPGSAFPLLRLLEPPKSEVLAWTSGEPYTRQAVADVYDPTANTLARVVVDLRARSVVSWDPVPGSQPAVYQAEWVTADAIVRSDQRWQDAMRARGLDPDEVYVDVWAPGVVRGIENPDGHRILRALSFLRGGEDHPYTRPIEGVMAIIDMTDALVLDVTDTGVVPVDVDETGEAAETRPKLPPVTGKAPKKSAIGLSGREVAWQGWHLRVGWSPREGIVLHQVGFEQDGTVRPIIHRLSLSEIYVPYADPDALWAWRTALDVGEYALGQYAVPQLKGIDVPANARLINEVVGSDTGAAGGVSVLKGATAIWERETGVLWSRVDPSTLERDARAGRQLVVSGEYAIGNDSYAVGYAFGLDGAIDVSVRALGTTLNKGIADGTADGASNPIAPLIAAPDHQHFVSFRIDFDVDGTANDLVEERSVERQGGSGNVFVIQATGVTKEASRDPDPAAALSWRVLSRERTGALGRPTGYRLTPTDWALPLSDPGFAGLERASFAVHPFWVTRYSPTELYAGGDHPLGATDAGGVDTYASPPEPVAGQDLVVWYTLGLTHHPETEEHPVMNGHDLSFRITPSGFFDRNPALDLPAQ